MTTAEERAWMWVLVGYDHFSDEYYPIRMYQRMSDAHDALQRKEAEPPNGSPGLADTYRILTTREAMQRCNVTFGQLRRLTEWTDEI